MAQIVVSARIACSTITAVFFNAHLERTVNGCTMESRKVCDQLQYRVWEGKKDKVNPKNKLHCTCPTYLDCNCFHALRRCRASNLLYGLQELSHLRRLWPNNPPAEPP